MARILVVDYGRDDLLALGSPLAATLRAWGHEVIEAEHDLDALQQVHSTRPDVVLLYDTLPDVAALHATLGQRLDAQGIPAMILHERVQQMRFTDMIVVDPQYRLGKSPRQFDLDELRQVLAAALGQDANTT